MIESFRMHPMNIISSIIKLFKDSIVFILLLFVFNFRDVSLFLKIGRAVFLTFIIVRLILIVIEWSKTKYEIKNGTIQIKHGVFQRKQNSIPLQEIQNITWRTPFYYRWFGITSLQLETSTTSDTATVQLDAVKVYLAKQIEKLATQYKTEITEGRDELAKEEANSETINDDSNSSHKRTLHFTPTKREVLKASFLSFSFLGLIPIIIVGYTQIEKVIDIDSQVEGLFSFIMSSWVLIVIAIILLITAAAGFGVIQTFLKYGKYEISSDDERIFIHRGLLNERSFSIQKTNVQAIRLNQSPLKKLLNFTDVQLISAGSEEDGDDISSLYPFLPSDKAKGLLEEILPQFPLNKAINKLPRESLYIRLMRIPWLWLVATGLILWFKKEWWFISPILFVTTYLSRYFTYKNTRFSWEGKTIQFKTGGISTDIFITNRKKVIEVYTEQTIVQKKLGLATINTVNRVKPVHHEQLQDIPVMESENFTNWYQQRINEIKTE